VTARRFPPPRSVEELDACFVVRDANGQALSYVYFDDGSAPHESRLKPGFLAGLGIGGSYRGNLRAS
jgi:hypothetical protein